MQLQPLRDDVLVHVMPNETKTVGGLFIPECGQEHGRWSECVVTAVGPGRVTRTGAIVPPVVAVGDVVLTAWRAGTRVELDEDERLVKSTDILGVVERERKVLGRGALEVDDFDFAVAGDVASEKAGAA